MSDQLIKRSMPEPSLLQISHICEAYGIGNLVKVMKPIEDTANMNIEILTQTGKYVVKFFICEAERYDFILSALEKLQLNNLPVLMPLKSIAGNYSMRIGSDTLQITKFVYGYPFDFSVTQAMSSGKMLRRFHDTLADTKAIVKPIASLYPSTDILLDGIAQLKKMEEEIPKEQIDSIIALYDEIVAKWESIKPNLPESIIHGDWHQKNQIYDKSGEVCCIMDFDFITKAERIFDVAYSLWRLKIDQDHLDAAKAFMEGYGPLTYEEIQYLPLEICRISYYYICASALSLNPKYELTCHFISHYPFIKWVLSEDGQSIIRGLCKKE